MKRSVSSLRPVFFARATLVATLLCASVATQTARANEFSLLPSGDPIYAQLSTLAPPGEPKTSASLTRYEAALQAARALLDLQNRDPKQVSRAQWRAVKSLVTSLRGELRQLGVDGGAALELAARNLAAPEAIAEGGSLLSSPRTVKSEAPRGGLLLAPPDAANSKIRASGLEIPLSQRLRIATALLSIERAGNDPFGTSFGAAPRAGLKSGVAAHIASENSLSYDFSRWLTVRAANSQRNLSGASDDSPLFSAPLFAGATTAKAMGGGLDLSVTPGFKLSTEIEKLRADTGAGAARIGGGASFSTWQNRLSMSMHLSRLLPEDEAALPATAAQLGLGLDVTRRLSFNLLYQGLFAESKNNNAGRVSGGVSLEF